MPALARWLLGLGITATLAANVAQGWSHGLVGAAVAAWPAVSLAGSYELLVWIIRTATADGPASEAADHVYQEADQFPAGTRPGIIDEAETNAAAVAAYRSSTAAGKPLSERKLAAMFDRTSRR